MLRRCSRFRTTAISWFFRDIWRFIWFTLYFQVPFFVQWVSSFSFSFWL